MHRQSKEFMSFNSISGDEMNLEIHEEVDNNTSSTNVSNTHQFSSNSLSPRNTSSYYNDEEEMYVITRTGKKELLDTNQITNRLRSLINRKIKIPHVNPSQLMLEVSKGLKSGINTYEIDEYAANASASASVTNPYYLKVAARIAIDNHQKNTIRSFVDKMRKAYLYTDQEGNISPLLSAEFFKYVEENQDDLEKIIDYNRDFLLDFFGFRTFQTNFSLKISDKSIERPQDMFMRAAIALHMNTEISKVRKRLNNEIKKIKKTYDQMLIASQDTINNEDMVKNIEEEQNTAIKKIHDKYSTLERLAFEEELRNISETYNLLSQKYYTQASPTYYNAGGRRQQFASCFLLGSGDSRKAIMRTADNISKISKWAGGIGVHVNEWRGTGSRIRSTNGKSSGIVPFLRHYQTDLKAFNQGGRRPGSAAIYLMPHHPDIMKFIELPRNGGNDDDRARDLFTSIWIPDLFMERVKKGEMWSLFDPDRSMLHGKKIDLSQYTGEEYKKHYLELESAKKYTKQISARELWEAMLETNKDVGYPYIVFGDTANRINMQANLGVLKSSNLCVSGDTLILTDNGYTDIKTLTESNEGNHVIWNGFEFSKAQFAKTGVNKQLLKITFSDGVKLKCTPEHEFAIDVNNSFITKTAKHLSIDDKIISHEWPVINGSAEYKHPYTEGVMYVLDSQESTLLTYTDMDNVICFSKNIGCIDINRLNLLTSNRAEYYNKLLVGLPDHNLYELIHSSIHNKITWLAGYLDAIAYLHDNNINEMYNDNGLHIWTIRGNFVKQLLNTLGINIIKSCHESNYMYDYYLSYNDLNKLVSLGLVSHITNILMDKINETKEEITDKTVTVVGIEKLDTFEDTYCFNEPKRHMGIFNGVLTKNCSEIYIYSDANEYGVCVICSIALPMFVLDGYSEEELKLPETDRRELNHEFPRNPYFDFRKFMDVVKVVCTNLNIIVDKTYHPCKETRRGNQRHRPIGIGIQGLADCYLKMRYPFASSDARKLNKEIFEALYFAALTQSTKLARKSYLEIRKECKELDQVTVETYHPNDYKTHYVTYTDVSSIPTKIGAYPSIDWNGGSPYTTGKFHWELAGLKKEDLSGMFDWEGLREHILKFGVKNSLLVALMPTASTSQLLGNNECFEPYTSNIYKRNTLAGEYIVINKYLMNDLYNLGIWNSTIKDYLIATHGSIQHIDGIPDSLKQLYPTVLEIGMDEIIQQAIDRQPFIDQGQSMNWYVDKITKKEWNKYLFKAWEGGLKTGKYYMHSRPAVMPQKFTLDPKKQEEMMKLLEKNKYGTAFMERMHEVCDVCSG